MIVGKDFVFGHIPKTGGTVTTHLFNACLYREILWQDLPRHETKHTPLCKRDGIGDGKKIVLGFRRLPDWYWSVLRSFRRVGWYPLNRDPGAIIESAIDDKCIRHPRCLVEDLYGKFCNLADSYLYSFHRRKTSDTVFLRIESILEDFIMFASMYERDDIIRKTASTVGIRRPLTHPFDKKVVDALYANNPFWKKTESIVYDDSP